MAGPLYFVIPLAFLAQEIGSLNLALLKEVKYGNKIQLSRWDTYFIPPY